MKMNRFVIVGKESRQGKFNLFKVERGIEKEKEKERE